MPSTRHPLPRRLALSLLAGGLALAAPACGGDDDKKADIGAVEDMIEKETGQQVDIDAEDGTVRIETGGDDGETIEVETGGEGGGMGRLPDGWPEDVPLDGFQVVSGGTQRFEGNDLSMMAALASDESPEAVLDVIDERMEGWSLDSTNTLPGEPPITMVSYVKDGRRAGFTVNAKGTGSTILVNLSTV